MRSDALGDQYQQHGKLARFYAATSLRFQILRSFEHDSDRDKPGPGMPPPHGWRAILGRRQNGRVLVGPTRSGAAAGGHSPPHSGQ